MEPIKANQIIYTLTAKCRDCYRCLRSCPVNAIGVRDGQAYIDDDKCISCGTCIRECPQHAKSYRFDIEKVKRMILENEKVVVSIAPSFASVFVDWQSKRIPAALRSLGFSHISQTSEGAQYVAKESINCISSVSEENCSICSACPVIVSYIEKYKPELTSALIPIVSPMIAHAKILKERLGKDIKVVFIGPCIAKKKEAINENYNGIVDAVLTFTELEQWFEKEDILLSRCEESEFDGDKFGSQAKLFPIPGGMLKTADIINDGTLLDVFHTSGAANVKELLDLPQKEWDFKVVEPLFCSDGCINGPGIVSDLNLITRRSNLIKYSNIKEHIKNNEINYVNIDFRTKFQPLGLIDERVVTEEEIQKILELSGKSELEFQLNCGACGYTSCHDNAKAIIMGMADPEMCIPYMRRMAEKRTDVIIETSPNGIVILDEDLKIVGMNPSFQKFYQCSNSILGRKISYLLDATGYELLVSGYCEKFESIISYNSSEYHQLLYPLRNEKQYIGIYVDITDIQFNNKKNDSIKAKTIEQACELLDHQIKMAQNIASFLGESTAKSEDLVGKLMSIYETEK